MKGGANSFTFEPTNELISYHQSESRDMIFEICKHSFKRQKMKKVRLLASKRMK